MTSPARAVLMPLEQTGFVPPPYPYDRLDTLADVADQLPGGVVDSFGRHPVRSAAGVGGGALSSSDSGIPPSIGTPALRSSEQVAGATVRRRRAVHADRRVGTKELVGTSPVAPAARPDRDTVLHPAVACPTYEMGHAGVRSVPVPWTTRPSRLDAVDPEDAARRLVLWVNSPANPTGALDDLAAAAGGSHAGPGATSASCEFTWTVRRTILEHGPTAWSPSTRCRSGRTWPASAPSFAGCRARRLPAGGARRRSAGADQRRPPAWWRSTTATSRSRRCYSRLELMADASADGRFRRAAARRRSTSGSRSMTVGPSPNAWPRECTGQPREFYGARSPNYVRVAVVQPSDRLNLVVERLGVS